MIKKIKLLLLFFYLTKNNFINVKYFIGKTSRFFMIRYNFYHKYYSIRINNSKSFGIRYAKLKNLPQWTGCDNLTPKQLHIYVTKGI